MSKNAFSYYVSPFCSRYASKSMLNIFSPEKKFQTWRKLWVALAEAESELGLNISNEQIQELKNKIYDINFETATENEKILKHDVMAHIHAYAQQCPKAAKIIHLGATSCYVVDNADIIIMKSGLELICKKLLGTISLLSNFADKTKSIPCLAFTHLQPAQLTTVGKRATLWLNDLIMDYENISTIADNLKLLGCKGTTGTQASFLKLFENNKTKVEELEQKIVKKMGFKEAVFVSGQTYSRKIDYFVCCSLSGLAQSTTKFATDLRLLQNFKELEEPFSKSQIGSSAMPYKKNPMKSERIVSIARHLIVNTLNPALTASNQWLERTLDDSANKRIAISEIFLAADSILNLMNNICNGLVLNEKIVEANLKKELPFMATENILMAATQKGGDRQKIHEVLRKLSWQIENELKNGKNENNLIELICQEPKLNLSKAEIDTALKPENFIGLSISQVQNFLNNVATPLLEKNKNEIEFKSEVEF